MDDSEEIQKPLVYRLTDQWAKSLIVMGLILNSVISLITIGFPYSIFNSLLAVLISLLFYFSGKWPVSFWRNNKLLKPRTISFINTLSWGFGFIGFLGLFVSSIFSLIADSDKFLFLISLSVMPLSISLGASRAWQSN